MWRGVSKKETREGARAGPPGEVGTRPASVLCALPQCAARFCSFLVLQIANTVSATATALLSRFAARCCTVILSSPILVLPILVLPILVLPILVLPTLVLAPLPSYFFSLPPTSNSLPSLHETTTRPFPGMHSLALAPMPQLLPPLPSSPPPQKVRAVRLRRDRIVVALEHKVLVYNFADLKLLHQIETLANVAGLVAVSTAAESTVLACPGLHVGQVGG